MHDSPNYGPDPSVSPDRKPTSYGVASLDRIREAFPALMRLQGGAPVAYFDAPGGTQVPSSAARLESSISSSSREVAKFQ